MAKIYFIQSNEYVVGEGSTTGLLDVLNRPLKQLLAASGDDVTGINVIGYAKLGHTHNIADISGSINADTLQGHAASDFRLVSTQISWLDIGGKPTTIAGYGITDAYDKTTIDTDLAGKADTVHTHDAAAIVSGVIDTARLGAGVADATKFLRGDQSWAVPAGGSGSGTLQYPDNPPAVPSTYDDEFNSATLDAKWTVLTALTAPNSYDIDTSIPSWLNAKLSSGTGGTFEITQAVSIAASTAFSMTSKLSLVNYASIQGAFIWAKDATNANSLHLGVYFNTANNVSISKRVANADSFDVATLSWAHTTVFLHLQRSAADSWQAYVSQDGISWRPVGAAIALTFAIATLQITLENTAAAAPCNLAVDWFRVNWLTL